MLASGPKSLAAGHIANFQTSPSSEKAAIHRGVTVPDLAKSAPYGDVVYRWYWAGITEGDENGCFNGNSIITRSETAGTACVGGKRADPRISDQTRANIA